MILKLCLAIYARSVLKNQKLKHLSWSVEKLLMIFAMTYLNSCLVVQCFKTALKKALGNIFIEIFPVMSENLKLIRLALITS